MKIFITPRGFIGYEGKDTRGIEFTIQESSLASDTCIWLGTEPDRMELNKKMVKELLPLLEHFVKYGDLRIDEEK